jgi:hypothetical protein
VPGHARRYFWAILATAATIAGGFHVFVSQAQPFDLAAYLTLLHERGHFVSPTPEIASMAGRQSLSLNPEPVTHPEDGVMRAYLIDTEAILGDWMIPYSWRQR